MKTGRQRFDETINYLTKISPGLAQHISSLAGADDDNIGEELSLGKYLLHTHAAEQKRHAMRALLLCQRVYLSDIWPKYFGGPAVLQPINSLPADWKSISLRNWDSQSEPQIQEGIKAFTVTTDNISGLQDVAASGHPGTLPAACLTLSRASRFGGGPSCYGAVMIWLFRSGLVSYRWYLKYNGANDQASLTAAFGRGRIIWPANNLQFRLVDEFGKTQVGLRGAPPNHIVHLYSETPGRWNGHWLITKAFGGACGCNNDAEKEYGTIYKRPPAPNDYSNNCTLNGQFCGGYKEFRNGSYERGVAVLIDPLRIPERM